MTTKLLHISVTHFIYVLGIYRHFDFHIFVTVNSCDFFFLKLKFLRISHYFLPATFSSYKVHNLCNLGDHPTERFTDYLKSKRHLISVKKHNVTIFGSRKRIVWRFLYHLCHCFQVFNDVNYKWKIRSLGAISCCMKRIQA